MKVKKMFDLYSRNAVGVFWGGLPNPQTWTYLFFPALIVHLALLPITMTFGAALKTLIDFFTRKELPKEQTSALNDKLSELDGTNIDSLISDIQGYSARSNASKMLQTQLKGLQENATVVETQAAQAKKWALQLAQLTTEAHPDPLKVYTQEYIASLPLDAERQSVFDTYVLANVAHCETQRAAAQKAKVQEYFGAEKNAGKKMQHVIYQHFFAPPAEVVADDQSKSEIKALAV